MLRHPVDHPVGHLVDGGAATRQLRLTGRGRLALVALVAMLALAAFSMGRASAVAATAPPAPADFSYVTVAPGDTLWAIARRAAPDADPRLTVRRLAQVNGVRAADLRPGQRLALPAHG